MILTRRLLRLARSRRFHLGLAIACSFLVGLLAILQARLFSRTVNAVFLEQGGLSQVGDFLRLLLMVIASRALLTWASEASASAAAAGIKHDLRQRLMEKIQRLGPGCTRAGWTGELAAAAVEGIEALDAYFRQYLPQLVIAALVPLSILLVVFPLDPLSALVLLLTAPLIPIFMLLIGKAAEALTRRQWETLSRLSAHFLDSLQGLTTLKLFGRSRARAAEIGEASDRFRDVTLGVLRVTFLSAFVLEMIATLGTAIVAVEVGLRLLYGHLVFEQALFLLVLAPEFYLPLRSLGQRFHAGMEAAAAARRIFTLLDAPEVTGDSQPASLESTSTFREIRFEGVCFTYPDDSKPILKDIDFKIPAGRHIALVGPSGAGKSTLLSLLLRFLEPVAGEIRLDGRPLRATPAEAWREMLAWVPQDPYLFNDTIAANLRLACPQASQGDIQAAARAAHLDDFIRSLPQGYATVIGEQGARLSAGQAQRLALARAFLKDAPILILDEPTSRLDPRTEMLLEESTRRLMDAPAVPGRPRRTVITIAHRLNTVLRADRILMLEGGRIVEAGTHRQLLQKDGAYARWIRTLLQPVKLAPGPVEQVPGDDRGRSLSSLSPAESLFEALPPSFSTSAPVSRRLPPLLRLLGFLRGAWGWVGLSVLLGAATVASAVGLMGASAYIIAAAALHPSVAALQVSIVAVRFFGLTRGAFRYLERLVSHGVTFRLLARLRLWFYQALEPLAPARLEQYRAGDLLDRILADVEALEEFYVRAVAPPLVAVVVTAGTAAYLAAYDPRLAWTLLSFGLLLGLGAPLLSRALSARPAAALHRQRAALRARLVDGIQGLPDLLAFGRGEDHLESLRQESDGLVRAQARLAGLAGWNNAASLLIGNLCMWTTLWLAIPLVESGRLPGTLLAVLGLVTLASFEALTPLPAAAQTLPTSVQAACRLFEVVDTRPAVCDPPRPRPAPRSAHLTVSDLTFAYRPDAGPVLDGVSFDLPPGNRLAVVGPSGAGKSTLVGLLLRFQDYSRGQVLLDGSPLREFSQEEVRRMVAVIPQAPYLFHATIRENLALARPYASQAELEAAAGQAEIHTFIAGLPEGYETQVGERGSRLSAGERQRLAIGRALLKDAPLLILDEPTADLDPLTERNFLSTLFRAASGRGLLLITHRLVGLENVDEILVLDGGRVVERGRHADLLAADGLYRCMWTLQNRILPDRSEEQSTASFPPSLGTAKRIRR